MTAKVTASGRITIPKPVRDLLGLAPGDIVQFHPAGAGRVIIEKVGTTREPRRIAELVGIAGPGPSTEEIMALTRGE
jgi:antitoxin PrlF